MAAGGLGVGRHEVCSRDSGGIAISILFQRRTRDIHYHILQSSLSGDHARTKKEIKLRVYRLTQILWLLIGFLLFFLDSLQVFVSINKQQRKPFFEKLSNNQKNTRKNHHLNNQQKIDLDKCKKF